MKFIGAMLGHLLIYILPGVAVVLRAVTTELIRLFTENKVCRRPFLAVQLVKVREIFRDRGCLQWKLGPSQ